MVWESDMNIHELSDDVHEILDSCITLLCVIHSIDVYTPQNHEKSVFWPPKNQLVYH